MDFRLATKKNELSSADFEELSLSANYRLFLESYLRLRHLSYATFARTAGFTRPFPAQIISGQRALTLKSFYAFEKALKTPLYLKKIFKFLVARDLPNLFPDIDEDEIEDKIGKLQRFKGQSPRKNLMEMNPNQTMNEVSITYHAISIYAAAGDPLTGSTLEQIEQRARLPLNVIKKNIENLIQMGLLRFENEIYYTNDLHVFMKTNSQSKLLNTIFKQELSACENRLSLVTDQTHEMFFASQFCIDEKKMPQLKQEFRDLILKFVDDSLESNGNRILKILTSLHL